ncbi:MAG: class I SAM-dependent methyltransferase [Hyphomonas sp.]
MSEPIAAHYDAPDLIARIEAALRGAGSSPETVTADLLAPIEEFHVGGRAATDALLGELGIRPIDRALDIGCGTGGTSRHAAAQFGCTVEGIDLTDSFIRAGRTLTAWLKLDSKVRLHCGSALDMPFEAAKFDLAWMFHVGMNIEAKQDLFREIFRVLKPGGRFLVYDVMRGMDEATPLTFPVPWSTLPETSFVRPPRDYETALGAAGFAVTKTEPRRDLADAFFAAAAALASGQAPRPPLTLALIMGETARDKFQNLKQNYDAGRIVPVAIFCRKPD